MQRAFRSPMTISRSSSSASSSTQNDILHDVTTVIDHALTRPWTGNSGHLAVMVEQWPEASCQEGNANVVIGKESYFRRTDG
jgi:hypothetical protein